MMHSPNGAHGNRFRNLIFRNIALGVVMAAIIGVSIIAIAPGYAYNVIRVEQGEPVQGSTGVSVSQNTATSTQGVDLLRTSMFTLESGWRFDDYSLAYYHQLDYVNETDGIRISGTKSDFRMYRYLNILIDDYDSVNFSFCISSVSGPMIYGIRLVFQEGWNNIEELEYLKEWSGDAESTFTYRPSMNLLRASAAHWLLNVRFEIKVEFPDSGAATIYDARVQAFASELLIPVFIDTRDSENGHLLGKIDGLSIFTPYMNISSPSHSQYSFIIISNQNESVYLPQGNYTLDYGWFTWTASGDLRKRGSFLLNITQDSKIFITVRMSVVQLYIESNIGSFLKIEFREGSWWDSIYHGVWYFLTTHSTHVYFPTELGPLFVEIWMNTFRVHSVHTNFTIGMNNIWLHVTFPIFNFFGIGLDAIQLFIFLILTGLLIALLISLSRTAASLPLSKALKKARSPSIILFVVGYLIPWVIYLRPLFTYAGRMLYVRTICIPTGFETNSYLHGVTFIQYTSTAFGLLWNMSVQIVFFWLPLFYMIHQSLYDVPLRIDLRTLLPPAIPGVFGFLVLINPGTDAYVGPGAVLSLMAFMIIALHVTHKWWFERKKNRVKINEQE